VRHRKVRRRLGRTTAHRKATLKNMARALLLNQKIKTTKIKAKEVRTLAERLISIGKENNLPQQRLAFSLVPDKNLVKTLFKDIAPRFKNRKSGYTRIIPLGFRQGDGANMVILELTEKKIEEKPIKPKAKKEAIKEKPAKEKAKKPEEKGQEHRIAPKPKTAVAEEIAKEKAKGEKKKNQKSFMKGLRRFFRSKSP